MVEENVKNATTSEVGELTENDEKLLKDVVKAINEKMKVGCTGCRYCMPCPKGIKINNCARISQLLRRSPSASWLSEEWQQEMAKIKECLHCGLCASKCPYGLDTPKLLEKNLEDYENVLAGRVKC